MASTLKVTNISTPAGTGNIPVDRPLSGSGASLTNLPAGNLTGTLPAIDGSNLTGVSGGKLLQFVHVVKSDVFSTASTGWLDVTGMSVTTGALASTGSKVLVTCVMHFAQSTNYTSFRIVDNSGSYLTGFVGDAAGSTRHRASMGNWYKSADGGSTVISNSSAHLYHTASSTSAQTYKLQVYNQSGTFYLNRSTSDTDNASHARAVSSISAMEVGA